MSDWSTAELWYRAETIPAGTPRSTAIRVPQIVRSSVGSIRSITASVTGRRRKIESPRLPVSRRPYQCMSCMGSGSSRPSWRRSLATSSGVAYGPAMTLAGSPGRGG